MIYDYQDSMTKLYITNMVRKWVKTSNNSLIILRNPKVREITEADLSLASTDDIVWTCLYLIGVGLLRYMVSKQGEKFDLALDPHWASPAWLKDKTSMARMNRHIEFMLDHESACAHDSLPLTPLIASLDIAQYHGWCKMAPKEPNMDSDRDIEIIRRNRKLHRAKLRFHGG